MRRPALLSIAMAIAFVGACWGPTEVDLAITTSVDCRSLRMETAVFAGAPNVSQTAAPNSVTSTCVAEEPRIGTLTLVPSGGRNAHFTIEVVAGIGVPVSTCVGAGLAKCILARRSAGFIAHQARTLPIFLSDRCIGVPCGADQTCDRGNCTPLTACDELGCPSDRGVADGGSEAGSASDGGLDATAEAEAGVDAGSECTWNGAALAPTSLAPLNVLVANSSTLFWTTTSAVIALPKHGAPAVTTVGNVARQTPVTADDRYVFYGDNILATLYRLDLATNTRTDQPLNALGGLASIPNRVFSVSMPSHTLYKMEPFTAGSSVSHLNAPPSGVPQPVAASSTDFYYIGPAGASSNVTRVDGTGVVVKSIPSGNVQGITADDQRVYLAGATVAVVPPDLSSGPQSFAVADQVTILASSTDYLYYFAAGPGSTPNHALYRKLHGSANGPGTPIVTGLTAVAGLATDKSCVYYWATRSTGEQGIFARPH